jgi:hypothetical protein
MQQYPVQINVGGATIFVVDVDQFVKVWDQGEICIEKNNRA